MVELSGFKLKKDGLGAITVTNNIKYLDTLAAILVAAQEEAGLGCVSLTDFFYLCPGYESF